VLSGSVGEVQGDPAPGAWVRVVSAEGESLGFGHWSPTSQIRVRLLAFGKEAPDDGLVEERIAEAVARRAADPDLADLDGVRLVNAEGDGLPGLLADRYGDTVVARLASAGMVARRERVVEALRRTSGAACGWERADAPAARREGVAVREGSLWGALGEDPLEIREGSRRYRVDVRGGQKTGFYLDQRDARALVERLAPGRRVLDLFAYTGGFSVAAACGGARSVTLVESSPTALALARENLHANAPDVAVEAAKDDAFRFVRACDATFDLLVIDPPPLARRRADVPRATRAYKDVLLFALRRAAPGALLLAFSCSHHVGPDLFRKVCFGASVDAGRPLQVLGELTAPRDHPVALDHPEGRYLSGLVFGA
jgi:23S rRNA (cytosine1962-C5)-methyltransferase